MAYLNGEKITLNPKFLGLSNLKPLYDILGLEPTISGDVVTVEELTALVEGINSLGITNLKKKLSNVADELTTVEIMSLIDSIKEIPSNLDHTVTFTVDGEPYEVISVKNGNSVNVPTQPTSENGSFSMWEIDGEQVMFPYTPTTDITITALFNDLVGDVYRKVGVSKTDYPYMMVFTQSDGNIGLCLSGSTGDYVFSFNNSKKLYFYSPFKAIKDVIGDGTSFNDLLNAVINTSNRISDVSTSDDTGSVCYINFSEDLIQNIHNKPADTTIIHF